MKMFLDRMVDCQLLLVSKLLPAGGVEICPRSTNQKLELFLENISILNLRNTIKAILLYP